MNRRSFFINEIFWKLCFLKLCLIFVGSVHNFGRSDVTLFSDKMFISHICRPGLMPNLIKKSWTVSTNEGQKLWFERHNQNQQKERKNNSSDAWNFFCLSFSHSVDMKCLVEVDQIRCSKLFEELYVVRRNWQDKTRCNLTGFLM